MPPYHQRFHTTGAIRRVMQAGRSRRGKLMRVNIASSKYPAGRIAVIVSKKVYKSAVKRNRIRRRVYNIVRHDMSQHNHASADMIITIFSQEPLDMKHTHLQHEVLGLLHSIVSV